MATLPCAKCGRDYLADVQFKTGEERGTLPHCRELERASDVPPGTYEGIADAYCPACMKAWIADEKAASFAALAESVARGELVVRRGDVIRDAKGIPIPDERDDFLIELFDDRALSPDEISAAGLEPDTRPTWPNFAARIGELDYVVFEGAERVYPTRVIIDSDWWSRHRAAVDGLLRERGWPLGVDPWVEPPVVVSDDHVVRVERASAG